MIGLGYDFDVFLCVGEKVRLVSPDEEINGKKPKLFNSVAVASNGDVYWSDSSTEFELQDGLFDVFADGTGRYVFASGLVTHAEFVGVGVC